MNQTNTALALQKATTRILRWRIPLFLALVANVAFLGRSAFAPTGAVAAQPTTATSSAAVQGLASESADTAPTAQPASSSVTPKAAATDIAAHTLPLPQIDLQALRTPGAHVSSSAPTSTSLAEPHNPVPHVDPLSSRGQTAPLHIAEYFPDLSDLADRWWPALESTAEAAAQLAAAQLPQAGELSIGNAAQNRVAVSFLLDGRVYTLHPGESHLFPVGTSWNIQFHRGGTFGNVSEPLTPGKYQFVASANGWTLQPSH